ncbi:hypothetical protein Tco_0335366 [Tanacetum coccineum]
MADHSHKWHEMPNSKKVSSGSSDEITTIANKLDSLGCDMKKLKENMHDIQVGMNSPKYHVRTPGYYTHVNNRPPFGKKRPNLEEIMNKHLEESTRKRADMEDWMKKLQESTNMNIRNQNALLKNLETQVEQLTKDYQEKAANEVPNSSIGQCKASFADNEAPIDETCRPFLATIDDRINAFRGEISLGIEEDRIIYGNNKIDETTMARRYNKWFAENNEHQNYGNTSLPYLGDDIISRGRITNPDNMKNPILSIKSYLPNFSHAHHNKPRPRDYSFKDWLKVKVEHTNVNKYVKNVMLNEWVLDSFDLETSSSGMSNDRYSRKLEEYKSVFDNEIE